MKYLYPEGALFQVVFVSCKSLFHDVPEQLRIAFTGSESTVAHNLFELRAHELSFRSLFWGAKHLSLTQWTPWSHSAARKIRPIST